MNIPRLFLALALSVSPSAVGLAQQIDAPMPQRSSVQGTVTDVENGVVPGATITVTNTVSKTERTVQANESGWFEVKDLEPSVAYQVTIRAQGFADWTSPAFTPKPGEAAELDDVKLKISVVETTVVALTVEQLARQEVTAAEKQRVLGIVPNFYVVYDQHPVALTTKLKFELAWKASTDSITILSDLAYAGMLQAGDTPDFQQGAKGYAQRAGASYAQSFSNIMLGGAILPSIFHQDPRYFYQGDRFSGKSRTLHAFSAPFICMGDNGHRQLNISSIGGDLTSGALTEAFYPASNRGPGLVFYNTLINTGGRIANALAQEFILPRFTKKQDTTLQGVGN
jgi:hypothetical protein